MAALAILGAVIIARWQFFDAAGHARASLLLGHRMRLARVEDRPPRTGTPQSERLA
jgi:hypothetical protein